MTVSRVTCVMTSASSGGILPPLKTADQAVGGIGCCGQNQRNDLVFMSVILPTTTDPADMIMGWVYVGYGRVASFFAVLWVGLSPIFVAKIDARTEFSCYKYKYK